MRRALLLAFAFTVVGCSTQVQFKNMVPGATITNVRWTAHSNNVAYGTDEELSPGELSKSAYVSSDSADGTGTLSFELVVDGTRVALVADDPVTIPSDETTTVLITAELPAHNALVLAP